MKVTFEFLGEDIIVVIVTNHKKHHTTQKEIVPTTNTFGIVAAMSYSHLLHILSSHLLFAVNTTTMEQYDFVVQEAKNGHRCADTPQ